MDTEQKNDILEQKQASEKGKIHFVLSHSYLIFLFSVVLGVVFDMIIPLKIFSHNIFQYTGVFFVILGTLLIYWAQTASNILKSKRDKENINLGFNYGPYKYLYSPTHLGVFIMTLGLAFIINSLFSVIFIVIAYILIKLIFIKKEENLLKQKYGEEYCNYKDKKKGIL